MTKFSRSQVSLLTRTLIEQVLRFSVANIRFIFETSKLFPNILYIDLYRDKKIDLLWSIYIEYISMSSKKRYKILKEARNHISLLGCFLLNISCCFWRFT